MRPAPAAKLLQVTGLLILLLVLAFSGSSVSAQSMDLGSGVAVNPDEGIVVGPFLFSPAVELTWENRDNIFFTPTNEVSSDVYVARARLMLELPIYNSYVRFSYMPQFRDYSEWDLAERWSHFVDVAAAVELASGIKITSSYQLVSGALETREIDPGGELYFGDRPFEKQVANLDVAYWITPTNGLKVGGQLTDFSYTEEARRLGGLGFFDYSRVGVGVGWLHQLSATSMLDVTYRREEFDASGTGTFFDRRDTTSDELTLGLTGQLTPVLSSELRVGWRKTEVDLPTGSSDLDELSSYVVSGELTWEMAHGSSLKLDLLRWDYPSAYSDNAFYTATGGSLTYDLSRGRLFGSARVRLQSNEYEVGDRSDDITSYGLGLGYRLTDLLSVRGSYLFEERDSLENLSYETSIYLVGLVVGY